MGRFKMEVKFAFLRLNIEVTVVTEVPLYTTPYGEIDGTTYATYVTHVSTLNIYYNYLSSSRQVRGYFGIISCGKNINFFNQKLNLLVKTHRILLIFLWVFLLL